MKKFIFALCAMCCFAGVSNAQFKGPYVVDREPMRVKDVLNLKDDSKVILKGHILNSLGDEKYTFSDGTAEVIVEIDNEDWAGREITPDSVVEIFGEVDKDFSKPTKIDVDLFQIK